MRENQSAADTRGIHKERHLGPKALTDSCMGGDDGLRVGVGGKTTIRVGLQFSHALHLTDFQSPTLVNDRQHSQHLTLPPRDEESFRFEF